MATKKTTKSSPTTRRTAAFKHGAGAFGAKYLRPGFAFTPEQDLHFALGYPHHAVLLDGDPADETPEARAAFVNDTGLGPLVPWPRGTAIRAVRVFDRILDDDALLEAMGKPASEITDDEAARLVEKNFTESKASRLLLLLEGLVGPDAVVQGALSVLAKRGEEIVQDDDADVGSTIYTLGFLLLRLPAAAGAAARAQLASLYEALASRSTDPPLDRPSPLRSLDVVLHGAAGSERSGHRAAGKVSIYFLGHVVDDPAYVARVVPPVIKPFADDDPDPRRAFLGGEEVLAREVAAWKGYRAQDRVVERFGAIRSELILPAMLEMSATSKAKRDAAAWFGAHRDFAEPFLAKTARGKGASAPWAKDVLAKLGG